MVVELSYQPRAQGVIIHRGMDTHRFGAVVAHRRMGKTVCAINHLQVAALECQRERPRFAFIAPTYTMAKSISWDYLLHYSQPIPGIKPLVSELSVTYPNGGQVRLYGADNPDSLRGQYFDGVVYDEFGLQPPKIHSEVIRPALSDRQGWALFMGTPAGKNQFYEVVQQAKADPEWFFAQFKASETGIIPAHELAAARKDMTADEYAQEYECSFEASVKGAIYATEIAGARDSGRVATVPYDPVLPVDTDWDLGVGDHTAIWFSQSLRGGEVRLIDYHEASGEGLPYYANVLRSKPYVYGTHWAPHDIQVRELASGRSRLESAASLGIRFQIAPQVDVEDGIHAARMLLPRCWFDAEKCKAGLEALQHYRRDWNSRLNEFKAVPVHDWACFTQDTQVLTRYGTYRIMDLPENGEVLTPCGWRRYEGPRITRRYARLVAVTLNDGSTVRCTPDHLWLTAENVWTSAASLQPGSLIQSCSIHSRNISTVDSIGSGQPSDTSRAVVRNYIGQCGWALSGLFRQVVISIIETVIQPIIRLGIWSACRPVPISAVPEQNAVLLSLRRQLERERLSGIARRLAVSGTADTPNARKPGQSGSESRNRAGIAGLLSTCWFGALGTLRNIARRRAKPLRIVNVAVLSETEDVCCIHVPDVECFTLANGAVVHNSHGADAYRYLSVRQQPPKPKQDLTMPYRPSGSGSGWML